MAIVTNIQKGPNVVGLQPDDRQPHDWLRMVARVFTAYRKTPLEKSIVAYIDGFDLTLKDETTNGAIIGITGGQCFVDDQFIGFLDNGDPDTPEAELTINKIEILTDEIYYIVLCYTWVNITPPFAPNFDIVPQDDYDDEHMLILGKLRKNPSGFLELIDDKLPWIDEVLQEFVIYPRQYDYVVPADGDFTLSCTYHTDYLDVSINGIGLFADDTEFITDMVNQTITIFNLKQGDEVIVRTNLLPEQVDSVSVVPSSRYKSAQFIGDGIQTDFVISGVNINEAPVFLNGSRLYDGPVGTGDYIVSYSSPDTMITIHLAPAIDDKIIIDYIY